MLTPGLRRSFGLLGLAEAAGGEVLRAAHGVREAAPERPGRVGHLDRAVGHQKKNEKFLEPKFWRNVDFVENMDAWNWLEIVLILFGDRFAGSNWYVSGHFFFALVVLKPQWKKMQKIGGVLPKSLVEFLNQTSWWRFRWEHGMLNCVPPKPPKVRDVEGLKISKCLKPQDVSKQAGFPFQNKNNLGKKQSKKNMDSFFIRKQTLIQITPSTSFTPKRYHRLPSHQAPAPDACGHVLRLAALGRLLRFLHDVGPVGFGAAVLLALHHGEPILLLLLVSSFFGFWKKVWKKLHGKKSWSLWGEIDCNKNDSVIFWKNTEI